MSASATVSNFGSEKPHGVGAVAAPPVDQIAVVDEITDIDVIAVAEPDVEIIEDTASAEAAGVADEPATADTTPSVVGDDVLDGFRDPIMPFVILGILSLVAILVVAAMLAL